MNKKIILIIAGVVILLGAVGTVVYLKFNNTSDTNAPATTSSNNGEVSNSIDDLGLCSIVELNTVKSALGSVAANLGEPDNTGAASLGDGDKGQTCVYPFETGATVTNSFYTDLAQYSQKSFDAVSDFTATTGTPISGLGDKAAYTSSDSFTGGKEFTITVIKGTNVYLFVIAQPESAVTFDDASAQTALTTIAQSAKLK